MKGNTEIFDLQTRVLHQLILQAHLVPSLGLLHGQTGIAIALFHQFRHANNPVLQEIANSLIDSIYEKITDRTPLDFADGLTGIGWGIEYLLQHGFVSGDGDEVCAELDILIFHNRQERDSCPPSLAEDIRRYALARKRTARPDILEHIRPDIRLPERNLSKASAGLHTGLAGWMVLRIMAGTARKRSSCIPKKARQRLTG
jgi:hypothetical protein